jgi:[ribosomal protein S5]-alanine N-acetyltransferase
MIPVNEAFPTIETERLYLREIKHQDREDIYTYLSDPEVMKYYGK